MPLWEYPIREITSRLDCRQWEFLTAPRRDLHLAILVALYRARQQETLHELPFDLLYERLNPITEAEYEEVMREVAAARLPCRDLLEQIAVTRLRIEQESITAAARQAD